MTENERRVAELSDGKRYSPEIAELTGLNARHVRKIWSRLNLPRPTRGAPLRERNPAWVGGRTVDRDGYVMLSKKPIRVPEHRVVAEKTIGRKLRPEEVVDHIDGITIHNDPKNLRVFATNGEHLRATSRQKRAWSEAGLKNIGARTDRGQVIEPVDTYRLRRERGDVRLRAILRAALELGTEHPCLSGLLHWLTQTGIDPTSRPSLERAWADLERRYAEDLRR